MSAIHLVKTVSLTIGQYRLFGNKTPSGFFDNSKEISRIIDIRIF
ncbi:hypothetical protein BH20BAC1_BH20BAC1_03720 [soil metagenome]